MLLVGSSPTRFHGLRTDSNSGLACLRPLGEVQYEQSAVIDHFGTSLARVATSGHLLADHGVERVDMWSGCQVPLVCAESTSVVDPVSLILAWHRSAAWC